MAMVCLTLCLAVGFGCSTAKRLENLESDVDGLLDAAQGELFPDKAPEEIRLVGSEPELPEDLAREIEAGEVKVDLRRALELAAHFNRSYATAKETLYSSALSLRSAQHDWDWTPSANVASIFSVNQQPSYTTLQNTGRLGFSKRLAAGGRLAGSLAVSTIRYFSGDRSLSISSLAALTLTQPLLRGSSTAIAREGLTQAERNLIYALRRFVMTREDLQISVARKYYEVLNAEDALEIARASWNGFKTSQERSEAMADANRVNQFEVDQARQRVLTAETSVVSREEALQTAQDNLKLALAIPLEVKLVVERQDLDRLLNLELPRPPMTLDEAVELALSQRLDFATDQDEVEDAKRGLNVAEDNMRTKLDVTLSAEAASKAKNRLSSIRALSADYSAQVDLDLPFDRMDETIALKRAIIAYQQKLRNLEQSRDELVLQLRLAWQQLQTYEKNITIQKNSVTLAERRVENTQLLFEGGRIEIRELLDSQDDLSSAKTALTSALVNHRICWLTLLYHLGNPEVDAESFWSKGLEM